MIDFLGFSKDPDFVMDVSCTGGEKIEYTRQGTLMHCDVEIALSAPCSACHYSFAMLFCS